MSISWLNPKLTVRHSKIGGAGVFAESPIDKGEVLVIQGGRIVERSDVDNEANAPFSYIGFQIKVGFYIYPIVIDHRPILDGIFLVNHSCDPNAGFADATTLISARAITSGEEICYDYAMTDVMTDDEIEWTEMDCRCNSANCRRKITGSDWKLPDLQKRYIGLFAPHVATEIAKLSLVRPSDEN